MKSPGEVEKILAHQSRRIVNSSLESFGKAVRQEGSFEFLRFGVVKASSKSDAIYFLGVSPDLVADGIAPEDFEYLDEKTLLEEGIWLFKTSGDGYAAFEAKNGATAAPFIYLAYKEGYIDDLEEDKVYQAVDRWLGELLSSPSGSVEEYLLLLSLAGEIPLKGKNLEDLKKAVNLGFKIPEPVQVAYQLATSPGFLKVLLSYDFRSGGFIFDAGDRKIRVEKENETQFAKEVVRSLAKAASHADAFYVERTETWRIPHFDGVTKLFRKTIGKTPPDRVLDLEHIFLSDLERTKKRLSTYLEMEKANREIRKSNSVSLEL